jgi:hypothetical protein
MVVVVVMVVASVDPRVVLAPKVRAVRRRTSRSPTAPALPRVQGKGTCRALAPGKVRQSRERVETSTYASAEREL